jgi:hypothetical protein
MGGGGGTSSLPCFLDGSLDDAMHVLEDEEALGFTSWWLEMVVLGFCWCRGWRSSWPVGIYIDKTANRQAASHAPRNRCPLRRALGHKRVMWSQGDVWLFIFYSKYQMPNYSYELFNLKKNYKLFVFLLIFRCCFMGPNFLGKQLSVISKKVSGPRARVSSLV